MSLSSTRAVVLRATPYGDTSLVVRVLTEDLGQIGLMARGIRARRGSGRSAVETFTSGIATFYYKPGRELQTLKEFAPTRQRLGLAGSLVKFSGASAMAEVVLKSAGEEPHGSLLTQLERSLDQLEGASRGQAPECVLGALWSLVSALGYRPQLEECVVCSRAVSDETVRLDFEKGGVVCERCPPVAAGPRLGPVARAQLGAFFDGSEAVGEIATHLRPHFRLLHDFIVHHVAHGNAVRTLTLLTDAVEREHA